MAKQLRRREVTLEESLVEIVAREWLMHWRRSQGGMHIAIALECLLSNAERLVLSRSSYRPTFGFIS